MQVSYSDLKLVYEQGVRKNVKNRKKYSILKIKNLNI